jgi:hypothetical protein
MPGPLYGRMQCFFPRLKHFCLDFYWYNVTQADLSALVYWQALHLMVAVIILLLPIEVDS